MITQTKLGGGGRLGNMLFGIASTIGIARFNNQEYYFDSWQYADSFEKKLPNIQNDLPTQKINEKKFSFDQYYFPSGDNYDLVGYFQSYKYFENVSFEILDYFTFTNKVKNSTHEKNPFVPFNNVAIHVRRGDYLNLSDYHTVLPMSYYNEAMSYFDNKRFIIFSDDMQWCRENFKGDKFLFANGNEVEDLYLMSMCESHIIANSSFSWWGAYLAGSKDVFAPKNWFGVKLSHHDTKDLYLPHWKVI